MTQVLFPGIKASGSFVLQHRIPSRQTTNRTRYQTQKSHNWLTKKKLEFCQVCQPTLSIFNFLIFSEGFWVWEVKPPPQRPHLLQATQSHEGHRGLAMKMLDVGELIAHVSTSICIHMWKTTTTNCTWKICCFKTYSFISKLRDKILCRIGSSIDTVYFFSAATSWAIWVYQPFRRLAGLHPQTTAKNG